MDQGKKQGFSLIELMVVVAIIGILIAVGGPAMTRYVAKAKQTAAKNELMAIYTAQSSFFSDKRTYHENLPYVGFVPDGYTKNAANCPVAPGNVRFYWVGIASSNGCPGSSDCVSVPVDVGAPLCGGPGFTTNALFFNATSPVPANPFQATTVVSPVSFTYFAVGQISDAGAPVDAWWINDQKTLTNARQGF